MTWHARTRPCDRCGMPLRPGRAYSSPMRKSANTSTRRLTTSNGSCTVGASCIASRCRWPSSHRRRLARSSARRRYVPSRLQPGCPASKSYRSMAASSACIACARSECVRIPLVGAPDASSGKPDPTELTAHPNGDVTMFARSFTVSVALGLVRHLSASRPSPAWQ